MTREEVYNTCTEIIRKGENEYIIGRILLPKHAIDAIIDCAVEEAVLALKGGEQE